MKRFTTTKFFLTQQEVLQKGTVIDIHVLKTAYEEFAEFIFSECSNTQNLMAYRNALAYTLSELKGMSKQVSQKDRFFLKQCHYSD